MSIRTRSALVGEIVRHLRSVSTVDRFSAVAIALVVVFVVYVLSPLALHVKTLGVSDWDQMEAHRYLVQKSLLRYGQFPFWNPYGCGGHTAWGGIESDTVVVSPWLPLYLFAPMSVAIRIEVIGSAILGVVGTWVLASRFTRINAFRAFVVVVWALNGRWALQVTAGHTWHLDYAWLPWLFFFLDRAGGSGQVARLYSRDVLGAAVCFAMMVYSGAIYPLPQAVVMLGLYASWLAVANRRLRPLAVLAVSGVLGMGLSLPKLVPMLLEMHRFPRLVSSPEVFDYTTLTDALLTRANQEDFYYFAPGQHEAWHEWGMYLGVPAVCLLVLGMFEARGTRERALKWIGLLFFLISLGAFHKYAPWAQMHQLPLFKSQHMPARWLYPALLPIACAAASAGERAFTLAPRRRKFLEVAALVLVAWIAADVGSISRGTLETTFPHAPFSATEVVKDFHTEQRLPGSLNYAPAAWGVATYPAEVLNFGTIDCITSPGLAITRRSATGRLSGLGAHAVSDPEYRGEAYIAERRGTARIESFSPNEFVVTVENATAGDHVVLNQNWDPGWTVNGVPAIDAADLATAVIRSPTERFVFRYRSPWWGATLGGFAFTVVLMVGLEALRRRHEPSEQLARPPSL